MITAILNTRSVAHPAGLTRESFGPPQLSIHALHMLATPAVHPTLSDAL